MELFDQFDIYPKDFDEIAIPSERRVLDIDIETYSEVSLADAGVHRYSSDASFRLLLLAFCYDDGPVQMIDVARGQEIPEQLRLDIYDPSITKTAHNAAFERTCLGNWFGQYILPQGWYCTMVKALSLGLPAALKQVAEVLGGEQKDEAGRSLIAYFSVPCKPSRVNGMRLRNLPHHDPDKWRLFKKYCRQDVETERSIRRRLDAWSPGITEPELYEVDQKINDRGVLVDMSFCANAIDMAEEETEAYKERATELTGLQNPTSVSQLKAWLKETEGIEVEGLGKQQVKDLLSQGDLSDQVRTMLSLRQKNAKSSVAKYKKIMDSACDDNRVRGTLQFCGAGRTARWAGRLLQVQNLPQNHLSDLDVCRSIIAHGDLELAQALCPPVLGTLSQLIRTAIVAPEGKTLAVADYSAIEARVTAWIAGEQWVLDAFAAGKDIYCETASQMFGVPVEKHGQNADLRQKGKCAVLACGYSGGANALKRFGADKMGMTAEQMQDTVDRWRGANPHIVRLWHLLDAAAKETIRTHRPTETVRGVGFRYRQGILFMRLPSGRELAYCMPSIDEDTGRIIFKGMNQVTRKWESIDTYGGRLTENLVQGTSRDLLANALLNIDRAGYCTVMHVHDEVIVETDRGHLSNIVRLMCDKPGWAEGLPLNADGYETEYYKKD